MEVLRRVLRGLDEDTFAYLEAAVEDVEDLQELLGPYFDDLGVGAADRRCLLDALALGRAEPPAKVRLAPRAGTLRDFWEGPASPREAVPLQPEAVAPRAVEEPYPSWIEGTVKEVDGQLPLPAWAKRLFAGAWRQELLAWPRRLSSRQVALLALGLRPSARKVATIIDSSDLTGDLCLAGGESLLTDKLVGLRRGDVDAAKYTCRLLFLTLRAADADRSCYEELLCQPHEEAMLQCFAGTPVEPWLRKVLGPAQPRYMVCKPRESAVKAVDAELQQCWGSEAGGEDLRVAVVMDAGRVRQSMIYVWRASCWWLLASVDFCQHGEAAPGHWHLNRTPTGDRVEHWGPRGEAFHGTCWSCPLWWLVIPQGLEYLERPGRLDLLPSDAFGDDLGQ